ncbi:MAG: MaoC/PaaZ C-terminal domain-containing protein [Ardenticatenaceae bacterium]|nr:MaoC/PaaZ C-terminal domain-containing protein [Ardenticatenaceae bacterium]
METVQPLLLFENVRIDAELPSVTVGPVSTQDLVKWAAATSDYNPIHYDKDQAIAQGLPSVVTHGSFKFELLAAMITHWIGPQGQLKRLACRYRGIDVAGDTLTAAGRVTGKTEHNRSIDCEVWVMNQRGEKTVTGEATVMLQRDSS